MNITVFHGVGKEDLDSGECVILCWFQFFASATIDLSNDVGTGLPFALSAQRNKYQIQEYSLSLSL